MFEKINVQTQMNKNAQKNIYDYYLMSRAWILSLSISTDVSTKNKYKTLTEVLRESPSLTYIAFIW